MRTVLFTTFTCYTTGGLHSRQARLAPLLADRGWNAVFGLAWGARFNDPFEFRRWYPDLETVLMDGRTGTRAGRRLAIDRAIRRVGASVVVPSDMADAFEAVAMRKSSGQEPRLVCTLNAFHPDYLALLEAYAPIIDRSYAVSKLTERALRELCGIAPERIDYVPTGVPTRRKPHIGRTTGPIRIGFLARLIPDKRPLDLIPFSRALTERGVDHVIDVFGKGELGAALASTLDEPLRSRIRIHPPIPTEQLYEDIFPNLDVAISFSAAEGNPNSLLEAMANGVVPVCADYASRAEEGLMRDGETALVFDIGDTSRAAGHVTSLANDPVLLQRLGRRAQQEIEERHRLEIMGDAFVRVLERAIDSPPALGQVRLALGRPSSRLESLFGERTAETIRRVVRYRYPHTDLEEWPTTGPVRGERTEVMSRRITEWLRRQSHRSPIA